VTQYGGGKKKEFQNLKIGQKILDKRKWGKKG
jgi:hypothetical protein